MSKKKLYENIYTPFATSSILTNYKRLSNLKEADDEQDAKAPAPKPSDAEVTDKTDATADVQPKQDGNKCKVIIQIMKNGKPVKKYCCPDEKLLPKHFAFVYKVLGKMENGKDDFKISVNKEYDSTENSDMNEVSPKGWEKTIKGMKKNKDIDNPYALSYWMKSKGYKHKK